MRNKDLETQLLDELRHASHIAERIQVENRTTVPRLDLLKHGFQPARRADLTGDGEVEVAALARLAVDPHLALHERDQALGNG